MFKTNFKKLSFLFLLRLFLGSLLLIIFLVFLFLKVVPFGQITYYRDYSDKIRSGKGFIYGFTPSERVEILKKGIPKIIGDPIYFSLFTPRTFDKAKVTIEYKDNLDAETPIIEAGVLTDKIVWNYDLKPLQNKIIDSLRSSWTELYSGEAALLQKNNNYKSFQDFQEDLVAGNLKDCPEGPRSCLAFYNYSFNSDNFLNTKNEIGGFSPLELDIPLRGAHQFFLYLNSKTLNLNFNFTDLNQDKGQDPITVNIYYGNKLLDSRFLDDNNLSPGNKTIENRNLNFSRSNLQPGFYKVELKVSDDIVIKKIKSSVDKLSFINKIWPVSNPGSLIVYSDADYLQVKAYSPASLQTLESGGDKMVVDEAYRQFYFDLPREDKIKEIRIKKDDIILENNGVFSWSPNSLINPNFIKVDRFFEPSENIKYIVFRYNTPRTEKKFKVASAEFNLRGVYRENGKYSFMVSIPGLKEGDNISNYIEIKSIKIELSGRTLWQKIFN